MQAAADVPTRSRHITHVGRGPGSNARCPLHEDATMTAPRWQVPFSPRSTARGAALAAAFAIMGATVPGRRHGCARDGRGHPARRRVPTPTGWWTSAACSTSRRAMLATAASCGAATAAWSAPSGSRTSGRAPTVPATTHGLRSRRTLSTSRASSSSRPTTATAQGSGPVTAHPPEPPWSERLGSAKGSLLTAVGSTLFFVRNATELWTSDGTPAGTRQLSDLGALGADKISGT